MNARNGTVINVSTCARCNNYINKRIISTDISTLSICNKNVKKTVLNYFILTFLIWILQYSNNLDSLKQWNYKNNVEITLYFTNKRSLAECSEILKERKEQSKAGSGDVLKSINEGMTTDACLQTSSKNNYNEEKEKRGIEEEKIAIEELNVEDRTDRCERRNFKDLILGICKNNPRLLSLYSSLFLSSTSFVTNIILSILSYAQYSFDESVDIFYATVLFAAISLLIIISTLIQNEKIKKR